MAGACEGLCRQVWALQKTELLGWRWQEAAEPTSRALCLTRDGTFSFSSILFLGF